MAVLYDILIVSSIALIAGWIMGKIRALLSPPSTGVNIPRAKWSHFFDFRRIKIRSLPSILQKMKEDSERMGYQVVEHPRGQYFLIWDADFADYVAKHSSTISLNHVNSMIRFVSPIFVSRRRRQEEPTSNCIYCRNSGAVENCTKGHEATTL